MTDITELAQILKAAAEKALQGKWEYEAGAIWYTDESGYVHHMAAVEAGDDISDEEHKSNMQFITTFTPAVVLELLEELSKLQISEANESDCADNVIDLAINWQMRCKDAESKLEAAENRNLSLVEAMEKAQQRNTELAQRVKTEASAIDDTQWYLAKPSEIRLLVEALEKAQQRIDELENDEVRQRLANAERQLYMAELAKNNLRASRKAQYRKRKAAEQRIAVLESRTVTVKLPKEHSATEFLFPVAVYSAQELTAALTRQGIKWEAE